LWRKVREPLQYEWIEVHAGHNTLVHEHQVILTSLILWHGCCPQITYLMFSDRASFFLPQQLFCNVMAKFVLFVDEQHKKK
jgi:hypothetical protein